MKIEILCVGNELLSGKTLNTNAQYISASLLTKGYETNYVSTVADEQKELLLGLKTAIKRADVLIITGGLGPTLDDNTKKIICDFLKIDLKYRDDIARDIEKRFGQIASIEEQATVPKSGYIFQNEVGTAPGFAFIHASKAIILLPGVPKELEDMFEKHAIVFIQKHFPIEEKFYQEIINITLLEELKIDAILRACQIPKNVTLGIYPSHGIVQITITTKEKDRSNAVKTINFVKNQIEKELADYIFIAKDGKIETAIHNILHKRDETIAFAESCTGGELSSRITKIPGSSKYFLGSFITYSNELKKDILKVSDKTLKEKGAVSIQTVKEMIKGVFDITDATYSIAISGIAGPTGGSSEKPVGTICLAIAKRSEDIDAGILHLPFTRSLIITAATNIAFGALFRKITHNLLYFEK